MPTNKPTLISDDVLSVAPALQAYMQGDVLDGLWKRPQLSPRDRSIVTLSVLITRNQMLDLPFYLRLALDSGLKRRKYRRSSRISPSMPGLAMRARR